MGGTRAGVAGLVQVKDRTLLFSSGGAASLAMKGLSMPHLVIIISLTHT